MIGQAFEQVLGAARLGEEWAWSALYRDVAPIVLRFLRARGARDPEDVLGDVFVQVVRKIGTFGGGEEEFRAWVFTIARNRLVDRKRQESRRPAECESDLVPEVVAAPDDTEGEVAARLSGERVRRSLEQLTPDQRDVLLLRIIADLSIIEVAAVLDKPVSAVKSLQHRGLAALRRLSVQEDVSS